MRPRNYPVEKMMPVVKCSGTGNVTSTKKSIVTGMIGVAMKPYTNEIINKYTMLSVQKVAMIAMPENTDKILRMIVIFL